MSIYLRLRRGYLFECNPPEVVVESLIAACMNTKIEQLKNDIKQ
ncbi:hypothetical protein ACFSTE_07190 [Aquimarina hainanensis]|uniref:Uncharacterized protein n=1 Tax=Aquimarina hainanensis TaxID=1578017 RepID=A0ABW5N6N6_9FLAO